MGELQSTMDRAAGAEAASAPEFETKRQLAARLGVSTRTIDNLLARGLPHLKLTRKLTRFPRAAVDEWLRQKQVRRG
jgi:excisionase family DNA binding protein